MTDDRNKTGKTDDRENENKTVHSQRRNSVILVLTLAAVFIIFYLVQRSMSGGEHLTAVIQIDGETVHKMPLDKEDEYIAGKPDGDYNIVIVKDGSVMIREANCKNQVCVKTGEIRNEGEVIACLPHKLIIYIE